MGTSSPPDRDDPHGPRGLVAEARSGAIRYPRLVLRLALCLGLMAAAVWWIAVDPLHDPIVLIVSRQRDWGVHVSDLGASVLFVGGADRLRRILRRDP